MWLLRWVTATEAECTGFLAQKHGLVGLTILLVGDAVNDGIDTSAEVDEQVANYVKFWPFNVLVSNLQEFKYIFKTL